MARRTTKNDVMGRLEVMNKYTESRFGERYDTDYHGGFGGWNLWLEGTNGIRRGKIGFDYRKTTAEMMAYIDAVINTCAAITNFKL